MQFSFVPEGTKVAYGYPPTFAKSPPSLKLPQIRFHRLARHLFNV